MSRHSHPRPMNDIDPISSKRAYLRTHHPFLTTFDETLLLCRENLAKKSQAGSASRKAKPENSTQTYTKKIMVLLFANETGKLKMTFHFSIAIWPWFVGSRMSYSCEVAANGDFEYMAWKSIAEIWDPMHGRCYHQLCRLLSYVILDFTCLRSFFGCIVFVFFLHSTVISGVFFLYFFCNFYVISHPNSDTYELPKKYKWNVK